jgi:biopolymer transport protein TolR
MAMQVGGRKGGSMADINVTPMADIMIVLLIIFMVITPMLQKGVDVRLPTAGNTVERQNEPKTLVVAVKNDADRTTYLGSNRLDNPAVELAPQLRELLKDRNDSEKLLYLKADTKLPYADVMKVMDWCREAGVEEVALIAERKVEG